MKMKNEDEIRKNMMKKETIMQKTLCEKNV